MGKPDCGVTLANDAFDRRNIWYGMYQFALKMGAPACIVNPVTMVIFDLLTIHFTHTFNPLDTTISQYALGSFGWLEKTGIILVALAFILLGMNLLSSRKKAKSLINTTCGVMFLMVGAGFSMVILFNVDTTNGIASFPGFMHMFAAISVSLIFPIACLLIAFNLANYHKHNYLAVYTAFTGLIGFGAVVWIAFPANRVAWIGISERTLAGLNLIWLIFIAPRIIKLSSEFRQDAHNPGLRCHPSLGQDS